MKESSYFVARLERTVFVRSIGLANMKNAPMLDSFLREAIGQGALQVCVDLSACSGMDSTFMGTLTCIHSRLDHSGGSLHVIHAAGRNSELLRGLGLDAIFTVDDNEEHLASAAAPECAQVPKSECGKSERTAICLESHEALAAADGRNAVKFRDVIELMRAEGRPVLAH